jgi:hypothetical protein
VVGPRKQLVDLTARIAINDPAEDVGQVGERIDLVQPAGLDQGRDDGPMLGTAVRAWEQRIFPVERDRTDRGFIFYKGDFTCCHLLPA